ncbi:MAG: hypothetical protein BWY76_00621 [bacterium ADurb.Bin429]|nr:MAG: hypothetical protein BWY76_00621 [bacterium ADurb.Bin429]
MLSVQVDQDQLAIGKHFHIAFMRTLRIPDDGHEYPLPPGLGTFPICRVEDYADRVPDSWREHGGVFIPMYQREALWVNFEGHAWHPVAAKLAVGKINAISGQAWDQRLLQFEQDYVVVPDQPWLDGINAGDGFIKQFVAMPLGMGYTVEGQLTGKEEFGGIQLIVFDAKPGRFPEKPPQPSRTVADMDMVCYCCSPAPGLEMGLGAGGRMRQKIYPDDYGFDTWDPEHYGRVYIHIVNSMLYREITGKEPPPTPISARTYTEYGLPWFDLYDEAKGDVTVSTELAGVKSIKEKDLEHGFTGQQDDGTVAIAPGQTVTLGKSPNTVEDGKW